jgi:hypothetical protein
MRGAVGCVAACVPQGCVLGGPVGRPAEFKPRVEALARFWNYPGASLADFNSNMGLIQGDYGPLDAAASFRVPSTQRNPTY